MPSSRIRAPSLISAYSARSTISCVADLAACHARARRFLENDFCDHVRRHRRSIAGFVIVPAGAGLLAETPKFANAIRDRRRGKLGMLEILPLADGPANIVAREVADSKRPHREPEFFERLVDLLRQCSGFQQAAHLRNRHSTSGCR